MTEKKDNVIPFPVKVTAEMQKLTEQLASGEVSPKEGLRHFGLLSMNMEPLSRVHFKQPPPEDPFKPKQTPVERRNKVRNSCLSGHMPGEEKVCPRCREARFNTITTGYYLDQPSLRQLKDCVGYLREKRKADDYTFLLEYLGLPSEASEEDWNVFFRRVHKIEAMSRWARNTAAFHYVKHPLLNKMVPLAPPVSGKSGLMQHLILRDDDLREIYASAVLAVDFEVNVLSPEPKVTTIDELRDGEVGKNASGKSALTAAILSSALSWIKPSLQQNRAELRRPASSKLSEGYKLRQSPKPHKRGDKNAQQFVKEVKPHPLLKGLIKKTEE